MNSSMAHERTYSSYIFSGGSSRRFFLVTCLWIPSGATENRPAKDRPQHEVPLEQYRTGEILCPVFFLKQVLVFRSFSSIGSVGGPFSTCEGVVGANTQTRTDGKLLTFVAIFSLLNSNFLLVSLSCFVSFSIAAVF